MRRKGKLEHPQESPHYMGSLRNLREDTSHTKSVTKSVNSLKFSEQGLHHSILTLVPYKETSIDENKVSEPNLVSPPKQFEDKQSEKKNDSNVFGNPSSLVDEQKLINCTTNDDTVVLESVVKSISIKPNDDQKIVENDLRLPDLDIRTRATEGKINNCEGTFSECQSSTKIELNNNSSDYMINNSDSGIYSLGKNSLPRSENHFPRSSMSVLSLPSVGSEAKMSNFGNEKRSEDNIYVSTINIGEVQRQEGNYTQRVQALCDYEPMEIVVREALDEELDCEIFFRKMSLVFPEINHLERLFDTKSIIKTRIDFIGPIFNIQKPDRNEDLNNFEAFSNFDSYSYNYSRLSFTQWKKELILKIKTKIEILKEEHSSLKLDWNLNNGIQNDLESMLVASSARVFEIDKFKLHIAEIGKIVSLILSLSGRLAKLENALLGLEWNGVEERDDMEQRRDRLLEQLDEAKDLNRSIKKRSEVIKGYLVTYLSKAQLSRFEEFIKKKISLMIDLKEIQEKITLGENQLLAVNHMNFSHTHMII